MPGTEHPTRGQCQQIQADFQMPETFTRVLHFRMLMISSGAGGALPPADAGVRADSKAREVCVRQEGQSVAELRYSRLR